MTPNTKSVWLLLDSSQMPWLKTQTSDAGLNNVLTILSLHYKKLYSDPNLGFDSKQSKIKNNGFYH